MKRTLRLSIAIIALWLSACVGSNEPTTRKELEEHFEMELGFKPSETISDIRCRIVRIGDTASQWMAFSCDDQTFSYIIKNGFTPVASNDLLAPGVPPISDENRNPNAPVWWPKEMRYPQMFYYRRKKAAMDASNEAYYIYVWRDSNGRVFLHSVTMH